MMRVEWRTWKWPGAGGGLFAAGSLWNSQPPVQGIRDRPVSFAPWVLSVSEVAAILISGVLLILGIYLAFRGGRDRRHAAQEPGKPPLRHYAGLFQSDANPITAFVVIFAVAMVVWALWYVLRIGANGLWY